MRRTILAWAAALALFAPFAAWSQAPQLHGIVLSDSKDGMNRAAFTTATKTIHLRVLLKDVPEGAIIRGDWIAVRTAIAPPNTKFNSARLSVGPGMLRADFTLDQPASGFPPGDYRVELLLNDRKVHTITYVVK